MIGRQNPLNYAATREALLPRLLRSYSAYYDVEALQEQEPLMATAFFHVHGTKYVLSKKAELWAADNNEYVYFFSVPHLTTEIYDQCLQLAYDRGMELVHPDKNHMSSYIVAIFLCDTCDEDAKKRLKRCRIRKSFQFSLKGWMEVHTAMIGVGMEPMVVGNSDGRKTVEFLKSLLFPQKEKKRKLKWK